MGKPLKTRKKKTLGPRDKFLAIVEGEYSYAKKTLRQPYVPMCKPEQAANYLLRFSDAVRAYDKIKFTGICYYLLDGELDLSGIPVAKESSELGDGKFQPLKAHQKKLIQGGFEKLAAYGINVAPCSLNIRQAFSTSDGFYRLIFFSFSQTPSHLKSGGQGHFFSLIGNEPKGPHLGLIGLQKNNLNEGIFYHEFGHSLELSHFPPALGNFDEVCIPEFYDKTEAIKLGIRENLCVVNTVDSVMFCSPTEHTDLPSGDAIAFKKAYDELIEDTPVSTPSPSKTQPSSFRKIKEELAILPNAIKLTPSYLVRSMDKLFSHCVERLQNYAVEVVKDCPSYFLLTVRLIGIRVAK